MPDRRPARALPLEAHNAFFDAIADDYDVWDRGLHGRLAERLVDLAEPARGEVALDVGCGTGLLTSLIAERVGPEGSVIALDPSERMLEKARARGLPNTSYLKSSVEGPLWFRDQTFDLLTFCDSLTFLPEPELTIADAWRLLRPGGRIALVVARRGLATAAQELYLRHLSRIVEQTSLVLPAPEESWAGEPEVLEPWLLAAGFRPPLLRTFVTGHRAASASEWLEGLAPTSLRTHFVVRVCGPVVRRRFEEEIEQAMQPLGDDGLRHHEAFTLAMAEKEGDASRSQPDRSSTASGRR
ncbi:MAG: methyltransferase domain-containing protein [bacterium]|jgi:ubiquinone/menaquinone biosynthesis C-methylase UbiE|nr:methyltransferase domain-containing protein [bacterium]